MGYYTGNGETIGGGQSGRTLKSFYEWGGFAVRQKCVSVTVRKQGVSLATAQAEQSSDALTAISGGSGTLAWVIFDAEGTRKVVSYSQIGGSNLYELDITTERYSAWLASTSARNIT